MYRGLVLLGREAVVLCCADGEFQPARLHSLVQGAARIKSGGETNTLQFTRIRSVI